MNIRKVAISTIIFFNIFMLGCTDIVNQVDIDEEDIYLYENTMTKVQNDVNEIINKDYKYVLDNMGVPEITTYNMKINELDFDKELSEESIIESIRLVYPKQILESSESTSSIFINIKNNKVVEVNTHDISRAYDKNVDTNKEINLIANYYKNKIKLNEFEIEKLKINVGQSESKLVDSMKLQNPSIEFYCNNSKYSMKIYSTSLNDNSEDLVIVHIKDDIIGDIEIRRESELEDILKNNINKVKGSA